MNERTNRVVWFWFWVAVFGLAEFTALVALALDAIEAWRRRRALACDPPPTQQPQSAPDASNARISPARIARSQRYVDVPRREEGSSTAGEVKVAKRKELRPLELVSSTARHFNL